MTFLTVDMRIISKRLYIVKWEFLIRNLSFLKANNIWIMLLYNFSKLIKF